MLICVELLAQSWITIECLTSCINFYAELRFISLSLSLSLSLLLSLFPLTPQQPYMNSTPYNVVFSPLSLSFTNAHTDTTQHLHMAGIIHRVSSICACGQIKSYLELQIFTIKCSPLFLTSLIVLYIVYMSAVVLQHKVSDVLRSVNNFSDYRVGQLKPLLCSQLYIN